MFRELIDRRRSLLIPASGQARCLAWLGASARLVEIYEICDGDNGLQAFLVDFNMLSVEEVLRSSLLYAGRLSGSFLPIFTTELNTFVGEFRPAMSDDISIVEIDPQGDLAIQWAKTIDVFFDTIAMGVLEVSGSVGDLAVTLNDLPRRKLIKRGLLSNNPERFDGTLSGSRSVEVGLFNIYVVGKYQWEPHSD